MVRLVNSEQLCEVIKLDPIFGLRESVAKKCKSLYILDSYYEHFKNKIDELIGFNIYLVELSSIKRASESIGRSHKIRVVGIRN